MRKYLIGLMILVLASTGFAGTTEIWGGYLKQSTAITVPVGPFEDDAGDGVLVTVTPADMNATFVYSSGTQVENTDLSAATNLLTVINGTDPDAWATVLITAANTANLGLLKMTLWDDGANICEPKTYNFMILNAKAYNLQTSGTVDVDTVLTATPTTATDTATAVWNALTALYALDASFGKLLGTTGVNVATVLGAAPFDSTSDPVIVGSISTDAITADAIAAGAVTEIFAGPNYANAVTEEDGAVAGTSLSTTTTIYLTATVLDAQFAAGNVVMFSDGTMVHFGIISSYNSTTDVITLVEAVGAAPTNLTPIYVIGNTGQAGVVSAAWNALWTSYTTENSFGWMIKRMYTKVMGLRK